MRRSDGAMTILQLLRASRRVTQRTVIDAIGKPKSITDLSGAENGNYAKPWIRAALATYYGKPESELFDEDGFAVEVPFPQSALDFLTQSQKTFIFRTLKKVGQTTNI